MSFLQPVSPHALHALSVLSGDLMVAANKGVQAGWLVPLSAGLCYLGKQGSFMPLSSISRVRSTRLVTVRWWLTRAKSCADLVPFWALQRLSFRKMSALGNMVLRTYAGSSAARLFVNTHAGLDPTVYLVNSLHPCRSPSIARVGRQPPLISPSKWQQLLLVGLARHWSWVRLMLLSCPSCKHTA
jgi:hypothetical protein